MTTRTMIVTAWAGAFLINLAVMVCTSTADPSEVILNRWADPSKCNASIAKAVGFVDIAAENKVLLGQCVSVRGVWYGRALFANSHDARHNRYGRPPDMTGRRIGLYMKDDLAATRSANPTVAVVVGFVRDCAAQWEADGKPMMVLGYCHSAGGPFIDVADVQMVDRVD